MVKKRKKKRTNDFCVYLLATFTQQDNAILIFQWSCLQRMRTCYNTHFQSWSVYNGQGNCKKWASVFFVGSLFWTLLKNVAWHSKLYPEFILVRAIL